MTLARFLPAYPLLHTKIESSPREVTTETTDTVLSGPVADWHWKVLLTRTNRRFIEPLGSTLGEKEGFLTEYF